MRKLIASAVAAAFLVFTASHSIFISLAFSGFVAILYTFARRKNNSKRMIAIGECCPELIDILISGAQSGLSLNESLNGLITRGPEILKTHFAAFRREIFGHGDFDVALRKVQSELAHPNTDLIFEALQISKVLGGAELVTILRLLGNYIREDLTLRREISVKHNWIRNSAHISAAAPWILLLLLSTQPSTASAFATGAGIFILITGLALTAVAYFWMNRLSRLPESNRIFSLSRESEFQ